MAMMISLTSNARLVAASFADAAGPEITRRVTRTVRHHGRLLQTRVRARASGRPGPRAPTGDYRRGINMELSSGLGDMTIAYVGTNHPQGRRLEMGFTGTDSLGRYFDQQPYPHFGPALDDVQKGFLTDLADAATTEF